MTPLLAPPHATGRGTLLAIVLLAACAPPARAAWTTHGGNAQHTALSTVPSQRLEIIHWTTPVDLAPQYYGGYLLSHYGTPLVTEGNTVIFPVKTGALDGFRIEARAAAGGALRWQLDTDYALPPYNWTPSVGPVITPQRRLYFPGAGGTVLWTDALDAAGPHTATRVAFFGDAAYAANAAAMDASLRVCTPLTSAADGTVYFGVRAVSVNPLGIESGLASVDRFGVGRFVPASAASGALATQIAMNCAPALSPDGERLYVAARGATSSPGYLLALSTADLSTRAITGPLDPLTGQPSTVPADGTSSPMVAPDGRVFFGVLGTPFGTNASRGWMLQFDSLLVSTGPPGAFGWDITPSLVPVAAVPGYAGSSPYLIMTKYNFYAGLSGGDGVNKLAILDPDDSQVDAFTGVTVMKEVRVIAGVTPDPDAGPEFPNAVLEWCINTTVVDPWSHSVLAGSEDGRLYRWDLGSNSYPEVIQLNPELGQAYTPSLIGPDGQVYTIHNATLLALGASTVSAPPRGAPGSIALSLAGANPCRGEARLRCTLPAAGRATLDVLDVAGRHVATLWDGDATAGERVVRWDGRDAAGRTAPAGIHFARLRTAGGARVIRLLFLR